MECGSGDYCNVSVNFYGFAASGNKGIALASEISRRSRTGASGGRASAASDFTEVEGDDDDSPFGTEMTFPII